MSVPERDVRAAAEGDAAEGHRHSVGCACWRPMEWTPEMLRLALSWDRGGPPAA